MNRQRKRLPDGSWGPWERLPDYPLWETDKALYKCIFCSRKCGARIAVDGYNLPLCPKCKPLSRYKHLVYIQQAVAAWRQKRQHMATINS